MSRAMIDQACQLASVAGAFRPDEMPGLLHLDPGERGLHQQIWRALAPQSSEQIDQGDYRWVLKPDARRRTLRSLFSVQQIDYLMERAPRPHEDDAFGQAMRKLLRRDRLDLPDPGGTPSSADLSAAIRETAALLDAAQFAEAVPALKRQRFAVRNDRTHRLEQMSFQDLKLFAEAKIKSLQSLRDVAIVLPRRHRGYSGVRRRLSQHLRGVSPDRKPILVTGIGGVGKSALVSRLISGWTHGQQELIPILLDFDRRQLCAGEPVEILQEFLRQLIAGLELRTDDTLQDRHRIISGLRKMRNDLKLWKRGNVEGRTATHAIQLSNIASSTLPILSEDWAAPLKTLRIALVLDTFEAVDRMGGYFRQQMPDDESPPDGSQIVDQIMMLEERLSASGFEGLRTVISGREDPMSEEQLDTWFSHRIRLGGLSAISGGRLLKEEVARLTAEAGTDNVLTDEEDCRQAADALHGHPLAILVFARYASRNPDDVRELLTDLERDSGNFSAEFAQTFLYQRILERIDDPVVKELAHPGLVVRQLNADVLRFVLAGPCLGRGPYSDNPLSEQEADTLLQRLQNEYWLVERADAPFTLRHRPDLRRLMLPGLFAGPADGDSDDIAAEKIKLRDSTFTVCKAAQDYFEQGPDASFDQALRRWSRLDGPLREMEGAYYRTFVSDPPDRVPALIAERMRQHLGEDLESLPIAWRARVKLELEEPLSTAEEDTLEDPERELSQSRSFSKAQQVGLSGRRRKLSGAAKVAADIGAMEEASPLPPPPAAAPAAPAPQSEAMTDSTGDLPAPEELDRAFRVAWASADFGSLPPAVKYFAALSSAGPDANPEFVETLAADPWTHPAYLSVVLAGSLGEDAGFCDGLGMLRKLQDRMADADNIYLSYESDEDSFSTFRDSIFLQSLGQAAETRSPWAGALRATIAASAPESARDWNAILAALQDTDRPADPLYVLRTNGRSAMLALHSVETSENWRLPLHSVETSDNWRLPLSAMALAHRIGAWQEDSFGVVPVDSPVTDDIYKQLDSHYPNVTLSVLERAYRELEYTPGLTYHSLNDLTERAGGRPDALVRIVRGLSPELYDPTLSIMQRHDEKTIRDLAASVAEKAPLWPRDLLFDAAQPYGHVSAPSIVTSLDRCGLLWEFLKDLAQLDRDADVLARAHEFISLLFFPYPDQV